MEGPDTILRVGSTRSRNAGLRTVDVARRVGCSVQQIRDLEREGVLPPVARTATGYRVHTEVSVLAASAYRAFAAGVGPGEASRLLRAAHDPDPGDVLALLDAAHARLHAERRDLALARAAAAAITAEPMAPPRPTDSMGVAELAAALGVRPSTLRHWDAERLVVPARARGARSYSPADVRDARIVHQLRQAGYGIAALRELVPRLRGAQPQDDVLAALDDRDAALTARSRALLRGAAALAALLDGPRAQAWTATAIGVENARHHSSTVR